MIMSKLTVLCKHKRLNKENVTDVLNKTEDPLWKFKEQVKVNPVSPYPSKLITAGAYQTFHTKSYFLVGADVLFLYALESLENLTLFEIFKG